MWCKQFVVLVAGVWCVCGVVVAVLDDTEDVPARRRPAVKPVRIDDDLEEADDLRDGVSEELDDQRRELGSVFDGLLSSLSGGHHGGLPGFFRRRRWWDGDNVCVDRQEDSTATNTTVAQLFAHSFTLSNCREAEDEHVCVTRVSVPGLTRTVTVTRRCCEGFERTETDDGEMSGCLTAQPLRPLREVLTLTNLTTLPAALTRAGLTTVLEENNVTMFAPTNDALEDALGQEVLNSASPALTEVLKAHIVPSGAVKLRDVDDEQKLTTLDGESSIRINKFASRSGRLTTANCREVVLRDRRSQGGTVQVVSDVLPLVTGSLWDTLLASTDHSVLKTLLEKAGLKDELSSKDGNLTLFAPTNDAMGDIRPSVMDKLKSGDTCGKKLLENHIVPFVLCSAVVDGARPVKVRSRSRHLINLTRDDEDVTVNGGDVTEVDLVASNGVMHSVDTVFINDDSVPTREVISSLADSQLTALISLAGGLEGVEELSDNVTMFLPVGEDIYQHLDDTTQARLQSDATYARRALTHHVVPGTLAMTDVIRGDREPLTTAQGDLLPLSVTVTGHFIPRRVVLPQCATLLQPDVPTCGGLLHLVDRVLLPPEDSITALLDNHPELSKMAAILRNAELDSSALDDVTLLAPSNDALTSSLDQEELDKLQADTDEGRTAATEMVRRHVIPGQHCCRSFSRGLGLFSRPARLTSLAGDTVTVRTLPGGQLEVLPGEAVLKGCDLPATTSLVHIVDSVVQPHSLPRLPPSLDLLFGGQSSPSETTSPGRLFDFFNVFRRE